MAKSWRGVAWCPVGCLLLVMGCGASGSLAPADGAVVDGPAPDAPSSDAPSAEKPVVDAGPGRDVGPDAAEVGNAAADGMVADTHDGSSVDADGGAGRGTCPSADAGAPDGGTLVVDTPETLRAAIIGRWILCDGYGFIVPHADYRKVISIAADGTFAFWSDVSGNLVRGTASYDRGGTWSLGTGQELGNVDFKFSDGGSGSIRPTFEQNRQWMFAYGVLASDSYFVLDPSWP
jgi:hypothetical protein